MLETALAKLLTLKVAAATVVTVAATGGVAVAAATGAMPNPLSDGGASATSHPTGKPSEQAGKSSTGDKGSSPSPSLVGLCHAFKAGAGDNPGKALENPAFTALITAAGDKDEVAAYCDALLAKKGDKTAPSGRPTNPSPSRSVGKPDSHPTSAPDTKPTGGPASRPTPAPTN